MPNSSSTGLSKPTLVDSVWRFAKGIIFNSAASSIASSTYDLKVFLYSFRKLSISASLDVSATISDNLKPGFITAA